MPNSLNKMSKVHELFSIENKEVFRVKRALISHISGESNKYYKRTNTHILGLNNTGVLDKTTILPYGLKQNIDGMESCFLGIVAPEFKPRYLNITSSTKSKPSSVLNELQYEGFETVIGMCMFGGDTNRAITESGNKISVVDIGETESSMNSIKEKVVDIEIKECLSLYEAEKIIRFTTFCSLLKKYSSLKLTRCSLILPDVQYYLYLANAYESGVISKDVYLAWIEEVNKRKRKIICCYKKRVPYISVLVSSLEEVRSYIVNAILQSKPICFNSILEKLSGSSLIWEESISLTSPQTWKELIGLSYVVTLQVQAVESNKRNSLLIHADDPLERIILNESGRISRLRKKEKLTKIPSFIGVYPYQNIAYDDPEVESHLYYLSHDSCEIKTMISAY